VSGGQVDHILKAEMGAILEDDLEKVHARIDSQVQTHMERALASQDSELGSGKAITQPNLAAAAGGRAGAAAAAAAGMAAAGLPADRLSALYYMRLLETRQARRRLLGVINYFVSIQRRLVLDELGLAFPAAAEAGGEAARRPTADGKPASDAQGAGDSSLDSSLAGGSLVVASHAAAERRGSHKHELNLKASDYAQDPREVMGVGALDARDDCYLIDAEDIVRVKDAAGKQIMYEEAVRREEELAREMLVIGTHYLNKFTDKGVADRVGVLEDLMQSEAAFYEGLKLVVDAHLECYEHCCDEDAQRRLAQAIVNLMARRPLLDLKMKYLSDSYASEVVAVQLEASLMREVLSAQMLSERQYRNTIAVRRAPSLPPRPPFPRASCLEPPRAAVLQRCCMVHARDLDCRDCR